ncbi:MAG TPA: hypothetical protein VMF60_00850, partial [Acidimicrobiales bacterium]|nr:hypothetical protein [Acidimicrobiales bacterium]
MSDAGRRLGSPVEARWMVAEALGTTTVAVGARPDAVVDAAAADRVHAMVERRLAGEPLQYVLGSWA